MSYIKIIGKVNSNLYPEFKDFFFVSYSPHEFEIGSIFKTDDDRFFRLGLVNINVGASKIQPIPDGFKSVCQFHPLRDPSPLLDSLPILNDWEVTPTYLCFTWVSKEDYRNYIISQVI